MDAGRLAGLAEGHGLGPAGNIDDEVARARLSVDRDPAQIAELYPSYPYDEQGADRRQGGGPPDRRRGRLRCVARRPAADHAAPWRDR